MTRKEMKKEMRMMTRLKTIPTELPHKEAVSVEHIILQAVRCSCRYPLR